jgi:hypothetical protein
MAKDEKKVVSEVAPEVAPAAEAVAAPKKADAGLEPGEVVIGERRDGDTLIVVTSFGRKIVKQGK